MAAKKQYFDLSLESLRIISAWAVWCSERALPIYEKHYPADSRPRVAIEEARLFADGGKRSAKLRKLAMDAFRASHGTDEESAAAAARAASLTAASPYTHPFVDFRQARHILGPAAYAALAIEVDNGNDPNTGNAEIRLALKEVTKEAFDVLQHMPPQPEGKSRIDQIFRTLDEGIRAKFLKAPR